MCGGHYLVRGTPHHETGRRGISHQRLGRILRFKQAYNLFGSPDDPNLLSNVRSFNVGESEQESGLFCPSLFRKMRATMRLRLRTCHRWAYCVLRMRRVRRVMSMSHPQCLRGSGPEEAYTRKTRCSRIHRVSSTARGTGTNHMRPSYETILDTIDCASCRGVHAGLLLESVSAT